jgi:hypothetical protein
MQASKKRSEDIIRVFAPTKKQNTTEDDVSNYRSSIHLPFPSSHTTFRAPVRRPQKRTNATTELM